MSNKGQLLQDPFLNTLRREHIPVSISLVNGIKLQGQIESFDQYVVLLRNTVTQMVYKHAISTIVPGRAVNFSSAGDTLTTVLWSVLFGAFFGLAWALMGYGLTRGRRDFTSVSQVVATRYEVLTEHKLAQQARDLLDRR